MLPITATLVSIAKNHSRRFPSRLLPITRKDAVSLLRTFGGVAVEGGGIKYSPAKKKFSCLTGPHASSSPVSYRDVLQIVKANFPKEKQVIEPSNYRQIKDGPIRFFRQGSSAGEDQDDTVSFTREETIFLSREDFELVDDVDLEVDKLLGSEEEEENTYYFLRDKDIIEVEDPTMEMNTKMLSHVKCVSCKKPKWNLNPVSRKCLACRSIVVKG